MAGKRQRGKRTQTGQALAAAGHAAKVAAMRDGRMPPRMWKAAIGRAVASRTACRGRYVA